MEFAVNVHLEPLTTESVKLAIQVALSIKCWSMEIVPVLLILFESMEFADHALLELSSTL
jgi:hypothetical protein